MKIIDKITRAEKEGRPFWSFEYFPPKTTAGVQNLFDRMERMYNLGPEFIDITWNAGGTSSDLTSELVATAQSVYGLETCMHLTCTNMPKEKIDIALKVRRTLSRLGYGVAINSSVDPCRLTSSAVVFLFPLPFEIGR